MINIIAVRHTFPENAGFYIDRKYGRDDFTFLHFHNSVEIVKNGKKIKTLPHSVILYSPKEPQYFSSKEMLVHDWFHFKGNFSNIVFENFKFNEILYPKSFDFITKIVSEMENEFFNNRQNREEILEIKIKELLIKIDRSIGEGKKDRNNISTDTEEQFRNFRYELFSSLDARWTVSDMAKKLGFSESRFFVLYKTIFGISPTADLINAKMNSAKNMLSFKDEKIENIATRLGYQNVTHFIRQFKSNVGVSPSKYRKINEEI